ncbi:MAG TPA: hypothetical protein VKP69_10335, partial [Isosphaeraceae bacterium]|nr:hypothetical protein [Isosphaeraceae bacterium]
PRRRAPGRARSAGSADRPTRAGTNIPDPTIEAATSTGAITGADQAPGARAAGAPQGCGTGRARAES